MLTGMHTHTRRLSSWATESSREDLGAAVPDMSLQGSFDPIIELLLPSTVYLDERQRSLCGNMAWSLLWWGAVPPPIEESLSGKMRPTEFKEAKSVSQCSWTWGH